MNIKFKRSVSVLLALFMLAGLAACGSSNNAAAEPDKSIPVETVSDVDALIAAIAPGAEIVLAEKDYILHKSGSYGGDTGNPYAYWNEVYDGYELVIANVDGLTISGGENTLIATGPRYADVLRFENCSNVNLSGFTAGHTDGPGLCSGDVLGFSYSSAVKVSDCSLYGCGVRGVNCTDSSSITVENTEIYDCSWGAVSCTRSYDFRLISCNIYDCGVDGGLQMFDVQNSTGFAVVNCKISDCEMSSLLSANYTQDAYLLGTSVSGNTINEAMFQTFGFSPVVDGCSFTENNVNMWYDYNSDRDAAVALSPDGNELYKKEFLAMQLKEATYEGPSNAGLEHDDSSEAGEDGFREITVSTVDELIAAIGSNRIIHLEGRSFNLAEASDYGAYRGGSCTWVDAYDGPGLLISNVYNMTIDGGCGSITAVPRYADVLSFEYCGNITITDLTLGHTTAPGECSGGVLYFNGCRDFYIRECRLYGCGILGISAFDSSFFNVEATEIYDCSYGAVNLVSCDNFAFNGNYVHDCGKPEITQYECAGSNYWNDIPMITNSFCMDENGLEIIASHSDDYSDMGDTDGAIRYRFPAADEEYVLSFSGWGDTINRDINWEVSFDTGNVGSSVRFKPGWLPFPSNDKSDADGYYTRLVSEGVQDSVRPSAYRGMSQPYMITAYSAAQFADGGAMLLQYYVPGSIEWDYFNGFNVLKTCAFQSYSYTDGNYIIMYNQQYGYVIVVSGQAPMADLMTIAENLQVDVTGTAVNSSDFENKYEFIDIAVG